MFADVVVALMNVLESNGYATGVSRPGTVPDKVFVQVGQIGGGPDTDSFANEPVVDLTVYGRGYGATRREALQVLRLVMDLRATATPQGFLFDAVSPTGPIWVENLNPEITEFLITVNIRSRTRDHNLEV